MFKELKETYENNIGKALEFKEMKNVQQLFLRECQRNILEAQDIKYLLVDSDVESLSYNKDGVYISLNENFNHMKLYIHDTDIDGAPMWLTCFGHYEAQETQMVKKILKQLPENSTVFDVGANIGWYSIMLKKCFPKLNVYSFEPAPENFHRLKRNFKLNNLDQNNLNNLGFYSEKGKIDFHFNPERTEASSIKNILDQSFETIQVDMDKMDLWVKNNAVKRLDFIKCDVEGAELFVYKGGIECIKTNKPVIMSEMLRKWSAKFNYHPNDIIQLFEEIGYECYVIADNGMLKRFGYVNEETIETNYFFLHPEVHNTIIQKLCAE